MAFPSTSWPVAFDTAETRVDGADTVYDDDFNYTDTQVRNLQLFCGLDTELIGENATGGPGGMASPIASGGVAFTLAAKAAFIAGSILQVGDNFSVSFVPKLDLSHDGVLYALGGIDATEELWIPFTALPPAGIEGRLRWDPAAKALNYDDSVAWNKIGAPYAYMDWATGYPYVATLVPVEEVIGQGFFNGAKVGGGLSAYFRAVIDTVFIGAPGPCVVRLYDMGPVGTPSVPVLITALSTSVAGGPLVLEQALTVGVSPGANQIANTNRMYELTVQGTTTGDSIYVGSAGMDVR